jgi:hypothetical protein
MVHRGVVVLFDVEQGKICDLLLPGGGARSQKIPTSESIQFCICFNAHHLSAAYLFVRDVP